MNTRNKNDVCSIENCGNKAIRRGLCSKHYYQTLPVASKCSIPGCDRRHNSKGFCSLHYRRWMKHGDASYEHIPKKYKLVCLIDGCSAPFYAKGYCQKHYGRLFHYGDPLFTKIEMHGLARTAEYPIWKTMIQRCYDKNSIGYHRYGGRGITVCDTWKSNFPAFYNDMGPRPKPNYQIDRIDNDGNYEPGNCRWVHATINGRNRKQTILSINEIYEINILLHIGGMAGTEIAKIYNVKPDYIYDIKYNRKWVDEDSYYRRK